MTGQMTVVITKGEIGGGYRSRHRGLSGRTTWRKKQTERTGLLVSFLAPGNKCSGKIEERRSRSTKRLDHIHRLFRPEEKSEFCVADAEGTLLAHLTSQSDRKNTL